MSLLRELIKEQAATGSTSAGGVANARGTLFGGGTLDKASEEKQKTNMLRRIGYFKVGDGETLTTMTPNKWGNIAEAAFDDAFDSSDVISKLDAAEKQAEAGRDTTCFGMEDEMGKLVKVYVRDEQAEDFEHALATLLASVDENADDENDHGEIAEVLYQLKDKFDIVDVDWGIIEGDEEEEQEVEAGEEGELEGGDEGDVAAAEGEEGDVATETDPTEADAKTALQSVIDVMKADAEAKKAEADAKKSEAEAKITANATAAAEAKVKQHEEILDMEAHENDQKAADKESKTLAKLAKYRHEVKGNGDVANAAEAMPANEENEEQEAGEHDEEVSPEELANLILTHLQSN